MADNMSGGIDGYCQYLESITQDSLDSMDQHVSADVHFVDPFNDVLGIEKMRAVFEDMFENVSDIQFVVEDKMTTGDVSLITWTLSGVLMKKPWTVKGASRLTFAEDGKLSEHIDFWDAGAGLYEHLPVIGWLPRALRRKLSTQP